MYLLELEPEGWLKSGVPQSPGHKEQRIGSILLSFTGAVNRECFCNIHSQGSRYEKNSDSPNGLSESGTDVEKMFRASVQQVCSPRLKSGINSARGNGDQRRSKGRRHRASFAQDRRRKKLTSCTRRSPAQRVQP